MSAADSHSSRHGTGHACTSEDDDHLSMPPAQQREYVLRHYTHGSPEESAAATAVTSVHAAASAGSEDLDSEEAVGWVDPPPSRMYACTDGTSLRVALALCQSELS